MGGSSVVKTTRNPCLPLLLLACSAPVAAATLKQSIKHSAHEVKYGVKRAGKAVGHAAKETGHAIKRGAKGLLSFGICGALSPELGVGRVVVGTEVICQNERWRADEVWSNTLTGPCGAVP